MIITVGPVKNEPGLTAVLAKSRSDGRTWKVTCPYLPAHYPGTGDTFTSVVTGSLLRGETLAAASALAMRFVSRVMEFTLASGSDPREGVIVEPCLKELLH